MKVKKIAFIVMIFTSMSFNIFPKSGMVYDEYLKTDLYTEEENGFVSTKQMAEKLAEIYLINIYGDSIKKKFPLKAILIDEIWYISGTLPEEYEGGVPIIKISKKTGAVLGFINFK